ncbi:MAG: ABC transporter permease, partial [Desulfobacterales bacterium]|nr:ABC transporter permease [Desulfobacterales bacterium]
MLFRRIYQFLIVFCVGLAGLLALKKALGLSDYVIPGLPLIVETAGTAAPAYFTDVLNTLSVTVLGQAISIFMAFTV